MDVKTFFRLANETRALFHRLAAVANEIHHGDEMTASRRAILMNLESAPQTVVQMARSRPVSRQHIQKIVNLLLKEGLVKTIENPAHRRSYLVALTARGTKLVAAMKKAESEVLRSLATPVS